MTHLISVGSILSKVELFVDPKPVVNSAAVIEQYFLKFSVPMAAGITA